MDIDTYLWIFLVTFFLCLLCVRIFYCKDPEENDIVIALTALAASMTALGSAPVTGTVLGSAITSAISAIVTPVPPTLQSTLENTLVKH